MTDVPEPATQEQWPRLVICYCGEFSDIASEEGHPASSGYLYRVRCNNLACWSGPLRGSEKEAIEAWYEIMALIRPVKDMVEQIRNEKFRLHEMMQALQEQEAEPAEDA